MTILPLLIGLALACFALAPMAQSDCAEWDLNGVFTFVQSNGFHVSVNLHRQSQVITGTAAYTEIVRNDGESVGRGQDAGVRGTIDGDRFNVTMTWGNGSVGIYAGRIDAQGRLSGTTYDQRHPDSRVTWSSPERVSCAGSAPSTPVPSTKPVRRLGKRLPTNSASTEKRDDVCASGYVWREAGPQDHVCVIPASRDLVTQENRTAPQRWNPAGAYGPSSCVQGYVWREAFEGDVVCVSPQRRDQVREENRLAMSRRVGP